VVDEIIVDLILLSLRWYCWRYIRGLGLLLLRNIRCRCWCSPWSWRSWSSL